MSFPYLDQERKICLRFAGFFLAKFQFFSKWNHFLLMVICTCPQIYCKQVFALVFWLSQCVFISCTLTVLKHFHFKENNFHCKPLLLPVLNNITSISCRECFALILLPVLLLLIWSVIIPYNRFSSCVSALIQGWLSTQWSCLAATF